MTTDSVQPLSITEKKIIDRHWELWQGTNSSICPARKAIIETKLSIAEADVKLGELFTPIPGSSRESELEKAKILVSMYKSELAAMEYSIKEFESRKKQSSIEGEKEAKSSSD